MRAINGNINIDIKEIARRVDIFSTFMESFNRCTGLPPAMANLHNRLMALEEKQSTREVKQKQPSTPVDVDTLIEVVDEPVNNHYDELKHKVHELEQRITSLTETKQEPKSTISNMNSMIIQLNKTLEDTIKRVHELEKKLNALQSTASNNGDCVTHAELKDTEKRIVKELTDKLDAEIIGAEERFDEKLKESIDAIKLDEAVVDDEEEDEEEDGINDCIDMD